MSVSCTRSVVSSLSSSETMCQLNERAQPPCHYLPFRTSELGHTHVYFVRPVASVNYEICVEIQQRVFLRKVRNLKGPTYRMAGMALSNASSITLQTSGVNVCECVCVHVKGRLFSIQCDCRFYISKSMLNISEFHHYFLYLTR